MRRFAFNIFAALSFLLCLVLIYNWLLSYFPSPLRFGAIDGSLVILSWEGQVDPGPEFDPYNPASDKFSGVRLILERMVPKSDSRWLGFRYLTGGGMFMGVTYYIIGIPFWVLVPLCAILPVLWLRARRRQRHRSKFGHCLLCGYDLRESKDKCPECGAAIPAPQPLTENPRAV
jgi:hypothetical protein